MTRYIITDEDFDAVAKHIADQVRAADDSIDGVEHYTAGKLDGAATFEFRLRERADRLDPDDDEDGGPADHAYGVTD